MIEKIKEAIREMIEKSHISPNTIRLHPSDIAKLRNCCFYQPDVSYGKPTTIFGLKIIETTKVDEGMAEIYNDEIFYERKINEIN